MASAYGLSLLSNRPVPGLLPHSDPSAAPDLQVIFGERPDWAARAATRHRAYGGDRHQLSYDDGTEFFIDASGARIWATWPAALTLEDTATYLLGPVLGFYLRLRGLVCLHASAVMLDGRCVAFLGPAGSGKSTLAAAFAAQGHAIVTEDVACLDESAGAFAVRPGYPRIRLWEDSARLLGAGTLPLLTPNWDKRFLALDEGAHRFHAHSAPLARLYLLQPRTSVPQAARFDERSGQEVLSRLVANAYGPRLVQGALRAHEFAVLGRLAQAVPVQALTLDADGTRLAEACDRIRSHARA